MFGLVGYKFSNSNWSEGSHPLAYVVAGNGTYEVRKTRLMTCVKKLGDSSVPKLPNMEEGISLNIPKLPFSIFNTVVAFCKAVYEKDATESTIMVFYNEEENSFKVWVPIQDNSAANSEYKRDDDPEYSKMCEENILVMVAHSHPWNGTPGPSGTDDKDEKEALLYMIVGNVKGIPTTCLSTCPGGVRQRLKFLDVFQVPSTEMSDEKVKELLGKYITDSNVLNLLLQYTPKEELVALSRRHISDEEVIPQYYSLEGIEVTDDWMKRHKKKHTSYSYTSGGAYGQYYNRNEDQHTNVYYGAYGQAYGGHWWQRKEEEDSDTTIKVQPTAGAGGRIILPGTTSGVPKPGSTFPDVKDVIDDILNLDDKDIARVILKLKSEGYENLVKLCIFPDIGGGKQNRKKHKGGNHPHANSQVD